MNIKDPITSHTAMEANHMFLSKYESVDRMWIKLSKMLHNEVVWDEQALKISIINMVP